MMNGNRGESAGTAGWLVYRYSDASGDRRQNPASWQEGRSVQSLNMQNKAANLLKTLGSVPETDKTKPILWETDRQTEA